MALATAACARAAPLAAAARRLPPPGSRRCPALASARRSLPPGARHPAACRALAAAALVAFVLVAATAQELAAALAAAVLGGGWRRARSATATAPRAAPDGGERRREQQRQDALRRVGGSTLIASLLPSPLGKLTEKLRVFLCISNAPNEFDSGNLLRANEWGYFVCEVGTSKEKILRFRTVLGTPMLRASVLTTNIRLGELVHPDRGWSAP
jgi:hypothetical protein